MAYDVYADVNGDGYVTPSEQQISQIIQQQTQAAAELSKWQLENRDIINDIMYYIKGFEFDEKAKAWMKTGPEKLNRLGQNQIQSWLRTYSSKNTILSRFKEEKVNKTMRQTGLLIAYDLFTGYEKYDIISLSEMRVITWKILRFVEGAYARAINGGERELLKTTQRRVENVSNNTFAQPRGGFKGLTSLFG